MFFSLCDFFQDIESATNTAYAMVTRMGFSDRLGNVNLAGNYEKLSSATKETIEAEVRRILDEAHERATKLLRERRSELDIIARALVEYEVLNLDEIQRVLRGEKLPGRIAGLVKGPIKVPEVVVPSGVETGVGTGVGIPGVGGSGLKKGKDDGTGTGTDGGGTS